VGQVTEVNKEICAARMVLPGEAGGDSPLGTGGGKGLRSALAQERAARLGRRTAEAGRALGCDDAGMEAAEAVLRAGC
jgi:hypothetical protein